MYCSIWYCKTNYKRKSSFFSRKHACVVAILCVLVHMATCSAGELTRLLKPCEICLQSFGSLLGVSTQPVFSGEKKLTSEKKKKRKRSFLLLCIASDRWEIQCFLVVGGVSLLPAYFYKLLTECNEGRTEWKIKFSIVRIKNAEVK